jgi:hypothetical protein
MNASKAISFETTVLHNMAWQTRRSEISMISGCIEKLRKVVADSSKLSGIIQSCVEKRQYGRWKTHLFQ